MINQTVDIPKFLTERGVKPSYQRIKILSYFVSNRNHPTVNDIYTEVVKDIPTLSKTTVYNTLNLFVEHNIIDEILIEENEVRYDWASESHGHFKCSNCGRVVDIPVHLDPSKFPELSGSQISQLHVYFKGKCPKCRTDVQSE